MKCICLQLACFANSVWQVIQNKEVVLNAKCCMVKVKPSSYERMTKALGFHFYVCSGFAPKWCLWLLCGSSVAELLVLEEEGSTGPVLGCSAKPGHVSGQSLSVLIMI